MNKYYVVDTTARVVVFDEVSFSTIKFLIDSGHFTLIAEFNSFEEADDFIFS